MSTSEAAPRAHDGARARRAVSVIAPLALLVSLVGLALGLISLGGEAAALRVPGLVLMGAGTLAGAWCLWHGARNEHERGRWFAVAAVFVGLGLGPSVLFEGRFFPARLR